MDKFFLSIMVSLTIFTILTLPHLISIFSFNNETGLYTGYAYPLWLIISIGIISSITSTILVNRKK